MALVFFMNIYAIIKELVQISQQVTSLRHQNSTQILKRSEKLSHYVTLLSQQFAHGMSELLQKSIMTYCHFLLVCSCSLFALEARQLLLGLLQCLGLVFGSLVAAVRCSPHAQCGRHLSLAGRSNRRPTLLDGISSLHAKVFTT